MRLIWTVIAVSALAMGPAAAKSKKASPAPHQSRGAYIVALAGCDDCHTPRGPLGQPLADKTLTGAALTIAPTLPTPWADKAPALAGGPMGYDEKAFVALLQTGKRKDGTAPKPPMPAYRMTGEDARAVARYVHGLKKPA